MDLHWLRCYMNPKTSLEYTGPSNITGYVDPKRLIKWKPFRIASLELDLFGPQRIVEALSYLDHLEIFIARGFCCTQPIAEAIFSLAATSTSLQVLVALANPQRRFPTCFISEVMARSLTQWIASQPFRHLELSYFGWESESLRYDVITAALKSSTAEYVEFIEINDAPLHYRTSISYRRPVKELTLVISSVNNLSCSASDVKDIGNFYCSSSACA
ncbi:hypothetical protein AC1031_011387 [Aphanomyces cochlioides]|nr:hypothetical protein AC1031_011387 [Aphanomyces cochlioides]